MHLRRFVAGFAATVVFHQAIVAVYHAFGRYPRPPWDLSPTAPFGVPSVVSLAFWGGLWAVALFLLVKRVPPRWRAPAFVVAGGVFPTLVALLLVIPLKGMTLPPHALAPAFAGGFVANAVWAAGTLFFARMLGALGRPARR